MDMLSTAPESDECEESQFVRAQSWFQRVSQLAATGVVTKNVADETRAQRNAADAGRKKVAAHIVSVEALQQQSTADLEKVRPGG